ncbi:MAG: hypothetical protein ABUT39_09620 [Acidobacteriota bacterium]
MADPLEEAKERLGRLYLGRNGIHAVGLRRSENAVTVYLNAGGRPPAGLVAELEREVAPHRLLLIDEESPSIT